MQLALFVGNVSPSFLGWLRKRNSGRILSFLGERVLLTP